MNILAVAVLLCSPNEPPELYSCVTWMRECIVQRMARGEHELNNASEQCIEELPEILWPESAYDEL